MSAPVISQRERTARIARSNDRARQVMGLACTAFVEGKTRYSVGLIADGFAILAKAKGKPASEANGE